MSSSAHPRNSDLCRHDVELLGPLGKAMMDRLQLRVLQHLAVRADRLPHHDHGEDVVAVVLVRTAAVQLGGDQAVLGLHEACDVGPLVEERLLDVRGREDERVDEREGSVGVVRF